MRTVGGRTVLLLMGSALLAFLAVTCGDSGARDTQEAVPDAIEIPGEAVQSLTNYKFQTALTIADEKYGTSEISFDGVFESPNSVQGTLAVGGGQYEQILTKYYGRPLRFEGIAIGNDAWWREPGGEWQPGVKGYEEIDPLEALRQYSTPEFYLETMRFKALRLPVAGPAEEVDGVQLYRVSLDRAAILAALQQADAVRAYRHDPNSDDYAVYDRNAGEQVNTDYPLPSDMRTEAWFTVDGLSPRRIIITFSLKDSESFLLRGPVKVRLQLDITDANAHTHIEAPMPLPSPGAPSGSPAAFQTPRPAVTRAGATATPSSR